MKWAEIEESAQAYRASQLKVIPIPPEASQHPVPIDPKQLEIQKQAEVDEIFRTFAVREALDAIGKDVWEEGEVHQNGCIFGPTYFGLREGSDDEIILDNSLTLVSNPFTEVRVSTAWPSHNLRLYVQEGAVAIHVEVALTPFEHDNWQLEVGTESFYNFVTEVPEVKDSLRHHPLRTALQESVSLENRRLHSEEHSIDINHPHAIESFHLALVQEVEEMKKGKIYLHKLGRGAMIG